MESAKSLLETSVVILRPKRRSKGKGAATYNQQCTQSFKTTLRACVSVESEAKSSLWWQWQGLYSITSPTSGIVQETTRPVTKIFSISKVVKTMFSAYLTIKTSQKCVQSQISPLRSARLNGNFMILWRLMAWKVSQTYSELITLMQLMMDFQSSWRAFTLVRKLWVMES